jgi:hypothetical protein
MTMSSSVTKFLQGLRKTHLNRGILELLDQVVWECYRRDLEGVTVYTGDLSSTLRARFVGLTPGGVRRIMHHKFYGVWGWPDGRLAKRLAARGSWSWASLAAVLAMRTGCPTPLRT